VRAEEHRIDIGADLLGRAVHLLVDGVEGRMSNRPRAMPDWLVATTTR
jgi:hypothetical protein